MPSADNIKVSTVDRLDNDPTTKSQIRNYLEGDYVSDQDYLNILSTKTNGIEALPYQFMDTVDTRLSGTDVGRKYAEKIFSRLPLLFLTPCEPLFMDDFSKNDQKNIFQGLMSGSEDILQTLNGSGRYYSTTFAYDDYYDYLDTMLACVATYLGIFDEKIQIGGYPLPMKIGEISWKKEMNDSFATYFSAAENLVFYLDGMTSVNESYSNDTTESSLASQINGYSDQAREIRFLFGDKGNVAADLMNKASDISSGIISKMTSSVLSGLGGGIVGSLADKGVHSVLNGGKIVFPEMWSNSQFDRSYSLDIKLRSPDHDSLSIFLNVLKPYCKILALTLPRQSKGKDSETDPNAYNSPFLVRAYSKGLFNIDMGIITGLSVTKGAECCWNDDGLPTQIDISIEIKDLYKSLMMSKIDDFSFRSLNMMKSIVNNTSYQDFLANMAGLNIGQMEMGRRIKMYYYLSKTTLATHPTRLYSGIERRISNLLDKLYNIL